MFVLLFLREDLIFLLLPICQTFFPINLQSYFCSSLYSMLKTQDIHPRPFLQSLFPGQLQSQRHFQTVFGASGQQCMFYEFCILSLASPNATERKPAYPEMLHFQSPIYQLL